jgi:hypothetical protein
MHAVGHFFTPDSSGINSGKVRVIRAELPSAQLSGGRAGMFQISTLGFLWEMPE